MTATAPQDLHQEIVEAAMHAPSVHKTQPWRFSSYEEGLDLWADEARRLPVLDPYGRQLHLSCGGALLHARVAARPPGRSGSTRTRNCCRPRTTRRTWQDCD